MAQLLEGKADPLVSVIIPCFNAGQWIATALESVYRQTWRNLEIIVVNDGSTDDSVRECERLRSPKLTVISQENRGQVVALSRGLEACKGTLVQYLDADDALAPSKIEVQLAGLNGRTDCLATSEWRVFGGAAVEEFGGPSTGGPVEEHCPTDWLVNDWREGGGMMYPAMWLLPIELVRKIGPWREDLTLMNDMEYFTRAVLAARRVVHCPAALSYYRKGHASMSGLKTPAAWRSYFTSADVCTQRLLDRETSERTTRVTSFMFQRLAQASYPYDRAVALEAEKRAQGLNDDKLVIKAGPTFNLVSRLLGWKLARVMQVMSGRP
jgi:glycosyltransferase involved in cell wall biosynthesis